MAFEKIAQRKIQEAIDAGEFDNLPNAGEKLDLDSYFALPAHLRMAYSLLKSANCVPQEIDLLKEVARLEENLSRSNDPASRARVERALQGARLRLDVALERMRAEPRRRV